MDQHAGLIKRAVTLDESGGWLFLRAKLQHERSRKCMNLGPRHLCDQGPGPAGKHETLILWGWIPMSVQVSVCMCMRAAQLVRAVCCTSCICVRV